MNRTFSFLGQALGLLLLSGLTLSASPVLYNIDFTLVYSSATPPSTLLPDSGSFQYDAAAPNFTNFIVNWYGRSYDLTAAANNPAFLPAGGPTCLGGATGAAAAFAMLTQVSCTPPNGHKWEAGTQTSPDSSYFYFLIVDGGGLIQVEAFSTSIDNTLATGQWSISPTGSVPEPATLWMSILAMGTFTAYRTRKS